MKNMQLQVESLLNVITFLLNNLGTNDIFDINILKNNYEKHLELVESVREEQFRKAKELLRGHTPPSNLLLKEATRDGEKKVQDENEQILSSKSRTDWNIVEESVTVTEDQSIPLVTNKNYETEEKTEHVDSKYAGDDIESCVLDVKDEETEDGKEDIKTKRNGKIEEMSNIIEETNKLHARAYSKLKEFIPKGGKRKCDFCHEDFQSMFHLSNHVKLYHNSMMSQFDEKYKIFKCYASNCTAGYYRKKGLHAHLRNNHGIKQENNDTAEVDLYCDECDKTFLTKRTLRDHMDMHEKGFDIFKCVECSKTFSHSMSLRKHTWLFHTKKECLCPDCGKTFKSPYQLKRHKRIHITDPVGLVDIFKSGGRMEPYERFYIYI